MAKKRIKSITSDPRWLSLVLNYRYDWVSAAKVLFDVDITPQQYELLSGSQEIGARVTVRSGHGTGKSSVTAVMVALFMMFFIDARVVLIATKLDQVKIGVFKNLRKYWKILISRYPWFDNYFELTDTSFYEKSSKGIWELSAKAYRVGQPESLAGEHAKYELIVVDEASGILEEKAFSVITGALTEEDNRLILLSQPTRDSGYFWRTHNDPLMEKDWLRLCFNSEDSSLVTDKFILTKFREYGNSRNSPEYMIKVRGEFPKNLAGFLLSADECVNATRVKPKLEDDWGWLLSCDVGNGRDSSIMNLMKVSGYRSERRVVSKEIHEYEGNIDPVNFGRVILNFVKNGNYHNITVVIDGDGVGGSTAKIVEEEGIAVQRIRWGFTCFNDEDKNRFQDIRALCTIEMGNAIKSGRMRIDPNIKTRNQLSKMPYSIDHKGRFVIMQKKEMAAKLNLSSPDRSDTYAFSMIADITPANIIADLTTMQDREEAGNWVADITVS